MAMVLHGIQKIHCKKETVRMKRYLTAILALVLCICLCGCDFWLQDTYVSVQKFQVQHVGTEYEAVSARSYMEVRDALEEIVEDCLQSAVILVPTLDEKTADYYMDAAVKYIVRSNAIGAYAVDEISYEIGTNAGEMAIALNISYNYNRIEILRIVHTNMNAAIGMIQESLREYDADITVYIDDFEEIDLVQMVQDYVDENPQLCMEMPQVTTAVYPETGENRIVVLTFTYRNSREVLRSMQDNVQDTFKHMNITGETPMEKYSEIYSFLMGRHEYTLQTSITPSYSLLRYGMGDSKAFATVYAAMCKELNLGCKVVSGTKDGEAWYWNIIENGDAVYHLDLLRCSRDGGFNFLEESQMSGYVWDYSAYGADHKEK